MIRVVCLCIALFIPAQVFSQIKYDDYKFMKEYGEKTINQSNELDALLGKVHGDDLYGWFTLKMTTNVMLTEIINKVALLLTFKYAMRSNDGKTIVLYTVKQSLTSLNQTIEDFQNRITRVLPSLNNRTLRRIAQQIKTELDDFHDKLSPIFVKLELEINRL